MDDSYDNMLSTASGKDNTGTETKTEASGTVSLAGDKR